MLANLGPAAPESQHQVGPGMDRREVRYPDVLEQSKDREFALLVDQSVVAEYREIEQQGQLTRIERTSSFLRMASTTSWPEVTWPNTVCLPSRWRWGEWQMKN